MDYRKCRTYLAKPPGHHFSPAANGYKILPFVKRFPRDGGGVVPVSGGYPALPPADVEITPYFNDLLYLPGGQAIVAFGFELGKPALAWIDGNARDTVKAGLEKFFSIARDTLKFGSLFRCGNQAHLAVTLGGRLAVYVLERGKPISLAAEAGENIPILVADVLWAEQDRAALLVESRWGPNRGAGPRRFAIWEFDAKERKLQKKATFPGRSAQGVRLSNRRTLILYDSSRAMPAQKINLLALDAEYKVLRESKVCENQQGMEPFKITLDSKGGAVIAGVRNMHLFLGQSDGAGKLLWSGDADDKENVMGVGSLVSRGKDFLAAVDRVHMPAVRGGLQHRGALYALTLSGQETEK